jgi:hypothetical protein
MFDNEHFIRSPLLLRVDIHIARFAGYSQSSETTPDQSPWLGQPCEMFDYFTT